MYRGLTAAEAVAESLAAALASAVVGAYLLDRIGAPIAPIAVLLFCLAAGVATLYWAWLWPRPAPRAGDVLLFAATAVIVFAALVWLAWPDLLPLGGGSDLTHHLQLVDFIDRRWRLPHTNADAALVGNMINYTPGFHLLASLAGAWLRTDGLHAVQLLLAVSVAIKVGMVVLIARRLLRVFDDGAHQVGAAGGSAALACVAAVLPFLPDDYFLGSFVRFSFLSQVVSEMFAVAMWLALVVWRDRPSAWAATLFGVAGVGVFLTWPVWVGPPVLVLVWVVLAERKVQFPVRARHAALALVPIACVGLLHANGRAESVSIVQSGGAAFQPEVARFGWPFLALASVGTVMAFFDRRARVTAWLFAAVALQTIALLVVARIGGADSPYMAMKMPHFAIYPMAVAGVLTIDWLLRAVRRRLGDEWRGSVLLPVALWLLLLGSSLAVAERFASIRRPPPAITEDLFRAGQFARTHVQPDCIEYLLPQDSTSYWLYLAVLGNPSQPPSGALPSIFIYREALVRWITRTSYPVTIADLAVVPREVRDDVDVLAQFGQILVGRRRGTSGCSQ